MSLSPTRVCIQDLTDHDADAVLVFVGCKRCSYTVSSICTKIFVDKCEDFILKVCFAYC